MNTDQLMPLVLAATPDAPLDKLAAAREFIAALKQAVKEAERTLDEQFMERIRQGGPFVLLDIRWYLGHAKKYRVRNPGKAIETLLAACGGDEQRFVQCLASGWLKHGAARQLLEEFGCPEKFDELFELEESDELREGKPDKKLMKADTRFVPSRETAAANE